MHEIVFLWFLEIEQTFLKSSNIPASRSQKDHEIYNSLLFN